MRILFVLLLSLQASCGYRAIETANLFGHSVIFMETFVEESPLGLSANLASAMHQQFLRGGLVLSHEHSGQHPRLSGKIEQITNKPSSLAGSGARIPAYQIRLKINVLLKEVSGKTLWEKRFSFSEDYLSPRASVENSVLKTESNKRRALSRLADKIAHEIHSQIFLEANITALPKTESQP
ncbi:MAG: LPS assembly lipoprotein LptE [Myxococcota bacterium]|nr:LPS assembly lipoprotein LptE [Myxococcota bacterium]